MANRLRGPVPALIGAVACAVALVGLMLVAYYVAGAQRLDATALHGFNTLESGVLGRPGFAVALLGGYLPFGPGLILLWVGAVRWGRKRQALAATGVMFAAGITAEVLKIVLAHPRIHPILGSHQVNAASFPSGSATSAMAMAVAALMVVPRRWRALTATLGAVGVFAVSFGVLISAWHFPSDVLGGLTVATGYGFAGLAGLRFLDQRAGAPARSALVARWASRGALEVAGAVLLAGVFAVLIAVGWSDRVLDYAHTYTTTVIAALGISAIAAALLVLLGATATADDL